jgi:CRP-like cAMP-binding protein
MTKKAKKLPFDPKLFLATANGGRTLSKYRTDKVIFSQGDPADAVFYIQKGQVKITVVSEQGKEAVVAVFGPDEFCGEGCLMEPQRPIVDGKVLEFVQAHTFHPADFTIRSDGVCRLNPEMARQVARITLMIQHNERRSPFPSC